MEHVGATASQGDAWSPDRGDGPQGWRGAPEYLPLFAPRAHRDAYRAYVSARPLDEVITTLPGASEPRELTPFDAFGQSGSYNRWKLARLYGARRVRVSRGVRLADG